MRSVDQTKTVEEINQDYKDRVDRGAHARFLDHTASVADLIVWRESIGISQTDMATLLGYTRANLNQTEKGKYQISKRLHVRMAELAQRLDSERGMFATKPVPGRKVRLTVMETNYVPMNRVAARAEWRECQNPE